MVITEKEIFDFLFHPDSLDKEILDQIKKDPIAKELIKEYESLQDFIDENEVTHSLKSKLATRIPLYKMDDKIELLPLDKIKKKINRVNKSKSSNESFYIDNTYKYFIKINKRIDHDQIFLFSSSVEVIKEYTLTFYPSNISIFRIDNTEPIVADSPIDFGDIDKIELEIH